MNKRAKEYIKLHLPYYGKIGPSKGRYKGIKGKAWDILSDFVRCRDFLRYKGECISSNVKLAHWRDGDAGHYISMASHGAIVGFDPLNIHLQSKHENQLGSMESGARFRDKLIQRYGEGIIEYLNEQKNRTTKADDFYFIGLIENIYADFKELKKEFPFGDFPPYI